MTRGFVLTYKPVANKRAALEQDCFNLPTPRAQPRNTLNNIALL